MNGKMEESEEWRKFRRACGFLKPDVRFGEWYIVDEEEVGEDIGHFSADLFTKEAVFELVKDAVASREDIRLIKGWGARLTAPGYLDCTSWCVFETRDEARMHLMELYG